MTNTNTNKPAETATRIKAGVYRYRGYTVRACYDQAYCGGSDRAQAWAILKGLRGEVRFATLVDAYLGIDALKGA